MNFCVKKNPSFHKVSVSLLMRSFSELKILVTCSMTLSQDAFCVRLCVCQDHQTALGSWSWDGSALEFTKPKQEGVCLCLLESELPFFLCRSHGWLLQQEADGVWHRDSHRPPQLCDCKGAGEEIQLKPGSNMEPLQHFAISSKESGLCLK